jgi:hypothetical protein
VPHSHRYAVTWRDAVENKVRRIEVREVSDSTLGLGFVCLSGFYLEETGPLVDPEREALARRLKDVERLHLNVYTIVCIEEIGDGHRGLSFEHDRSRLLLLPTPGADPEPSGSR